jgi:Ca2+-binding EF-hand superfamily protein
MQQTFKPSNRVPFIVIFAALAWSATTVHAEEMKAQADKAKNTLSLFSKLDANEDGYVTIEEAAGQISPETFSAADKNHDGKLDVSEFKASGLDENK